MIRFINRFTGNEMWVAEDRAEEYKAAGHKLAASDDAQIKVRMPAKGSADAAAEPSEKPVAKKKSSKKK